MYLVASNAITFPLFYLIESIKVLALLFNFKDSDLLSNAEKVAISLDFKLAGTFNEAKRLNF